MRERPWRHPRLHRSVGAEAAVAGRGSVRGGVPRVDGGPGVARREEPLTAADLVRCLSELGSVCSPTPSYSEAALSWLLGSLGRGPQAGALRQALVRSSAGEEIGWYIRFTNRRGTSEVVQMGARKDRYASLLDHVFHAAWREGSVAVSGRVQPPFLETLGQKGCVFSTNGPPVLIHSRQTDLLRAIEGGRAFLSRLEGEWWMSYLSEG